MRKAPAAAAVLAVGWAASAWGQAAVPSPASQPSDGPASAELRAIVAADQAPRQGAALPTTPEAIRTFVAADRERRERVAALVREGKLRTGEDFDNAALVFQHGETPDDYLAAHELAIVAVLKGRRNSLPATAEDRFLEHVGRTQRFGTQFQIGKDGKMTLSPVAKGRATDVTDALRADLFVPTPAQWGAHPDEKAFDRAMPRIKARASRGADAAFIAKAAKRPEAAELRRLASGETGAGTAALRRVLALYRADRLATPEDYENAARVLRRDGEGDALLLAHELAVVAAFRGDARALPLAARALDDFLVGAGRPQRYGTVPGAAVSGAVTDALRAEFGVPPLAKAAGAASAAAPGRVDGGKGSE